MQPFISACLIVKNEEKMLRQCLESLKGHVDEIVITDTGSTDKTTEIAREFTDKVYDFAWTDNFAEARNFSASHASGEWILAIDADECIDAESFAKMKKQLQDPDLKSDSYAIEILSFVGKTGEQIARNRMLRLYKNDGTFQYEGAIHEQLKKKTGMQQNPTMSELILYHYGYLNKVVEEKEKRERNMAIVKKGLSKGKKDGFAYFNYGQELRRIGKEEEALDALIQAYKYKTDINNDWVRLCLAYIVDILIRLKRYNDALRIINDAQAVWPHTADFMYWRGLVYYEQKRLDDAKEIFLEILDTGAYQDTIFLYESKGFYPATLLAEIYEAEKNDEQALKRYVQAYNHNHASVPVVAHILKIVSKFHTVEEVYDFVVRNAFLRTAEQSLAVVKILLERGYGALALLLARENLKGQKLLCKAIELKASLSQAEEVQEAGTFSTDELLYGVQAGILDVTDLCLLYYMTKDERVQDLIEKTEFKYIFLFLFREDEYSKRMKPREYTELLGKALRFRQAEFAEKLISRKQEINGEVDAKIADVFYENGYEDIAIDFYQLADEQHMTKQGYLNIIEWLLSHGEKEEAKRFALEGVQRFEKDFRFYKYAITLDRKGKKALMKKAQEIFLDSSWLKKQQFAF